MAYNFQEEENKNASTSEKNTEHRLRKQIFLALEEPRSSQAGIIWGNLNIIAILVSVVTAVMISLPEYHGDVPPALFGLEAGVVGFFTLDYLLRICTAPVWYLWMLKISSIADLVATVPFYIELAVGTSRSPLFFLRAVRLIRLVRVFKLRRYTPLFKHRYYQMCGSVGCTPNLWWINYITKNLWDQIKAVFFISIYIVIFPLLTMGTVVKDLEIIFAGLIAVVFGLFLFVEGLKFGLMPLGDMIGTLLPKQMPLWALLTVAFFLGILVTFAEPSIGALTTLATLVSRQEAPYLSYLLDEWNLLLMFFVGVGVGVAAVLGMLRFYYNWSLKTLIYISLPFSISLTAILMWALPDLRLIIGLAWDCGAITTGPVTVPIVLAMGLGVAREYAGEGSTSGFGIVTLASVYPIVSVQLLAFIALSKSKEDIIGDGITETETETPWNEETPVEEILLGLRAVIPLVIFLVFVAKVVLRKPLPSISFRSAVSGQEEQGKDNGVLTLIVGIACAQIGMIIFNFGLTFGLAKLGEEIGTLLPGAFTDTDSVENSPRFDYGLGIFIAFVFAWILGYLATQAEPALQVMGAKVEEMGEMSKNALVLAVSIGVAFGVAIGVIKVIFDIPLIYFILVGYSVAVICTVFSSEFLVNVAWDSAGVTTGPVTVPFVLSIGVSFGAAVDTSDGFGILTLASIGPIVSVLVTAFIVKLVKYVKTLRTKPSNEDPNDAELKEFPQLTDLPPSPLAAETKNFSEESIVVKD